NTVPVVANGKVFVASNRALMIFGLGAQASASAGLVAITSATNARAPAREAVLYGTVVQVDGSTLWLRTRTDMARIDVSDAENSGKTVTIVPGGAVEVVGQLQSDGI